MTNTAPAYLAGLCLAGRRVVVIGAGATAQRRLPRLLEAGADVHVVAPTTTRAIDSLAVAGLVTLERRAYRDGDLDGAWYAMAVTGDSLVNAQVIAEAESRRVFCVRSENTWDAGAVTPAIACHDGLTVGVLAGGDHQRSSAVAASLGEALVAGAVSDVGDAGDLRGSVALVGGGPGDPGLITVRGRALLARADVVVADHLAPAELLDTLRPGTVIVDAAKIPYGASMPQEAINAALVTYAKAGKFVVRYKGGDPFLFGRGHEEVLACSEAGVPVRVVPGITSAFAVPALAGVPVTHRGIAQEVVVVSGHIDPGGPSTIDWDALGRLRGTVVVLMGVKNAARIGSALIAGGRDPETPVLIVQEGMSRTERTVRCELGALGRTVADRDVRPPAVFVIGSVAALGDGVVAGGEAAAEAGG